MNYVSKKNPYKFTIGFDSKNENHIKVAAILNEVGKGMTQLIVDAILEHVSGKKSNETSALSVIELRQLLKQLVSEEVKQASKTLQIMEKERMEISISEDDNMLELEDSAVENILNTLDAFRSIDG